MVRGVKGLAQSVKLGQEFYQVIGVVDGMTIVLDEDSSRIRSQAVTDFLNRARAGYCENARAWLEEN